MTGKNGETYGGYKWPLPKEGKPGKWTVPIDGELLPCENGYHLTDAEHLLDWINDEMYEVEYRGKLVKSDYGDKYVVKQARLTRRVEKWNDKTLRLFAVWCARNALSLVENPDPRSVNSVDVAERFANGEATREELCAAWDAARSAALDAAWDAARSAAWDAARSAAWDAAGSAAWDAAWDAAWSPAWSAQHKKLREMLEI